MRLGLFRNCVAIFVMVAAISSARADGSIRVGVLHSLTGTFAISEAPLKDVILMLIAEQNAAGGLLGRRLEPVVVDPASDPALFAEKARALLVEDQVDVIFGAWSSASRKAILPVLRAHDGLLFYPTQYEGRELERGVFYTGAAPNQQALPAVEHFLTDEGVKRWFLLGSDYIYPRTINVLIENFLRYRGVAAADIKTVYTALGERDWADIVSQIKDFSRAGSRSIVVSSINGDANLFFYRELARQGVDSADTQVLAFSIGENELSGVDNTPLEGHLATWNYFQTIDTDENLDFIERFRAFTGDPHRVVSDPIEAHVIGFTLWAKAVKRAGKTAPDAIRRAITGLRAPNLSGGEAVMLSNHHITKPVFIGEIRANGGFDVIWRSDGMVAGEPWTDGVTPILISPSDRP